MYTSSFHLQHEVALLEEEKLLLEERVKELTVSLEKALEQEKRRSTDIAEDIGTTSKTLSPLYVMILFSNSIRGIVTVTGLTVSAATSTSGEERDDTEDEGIRPAD